MAENATPERYTKKDPFPPPRPFFVLHAISAWSVKTRQAPSRHCRGCEGLWQVYGLPTTAMHEASTTPAPQFPTMMLQFPHRHCSSSLVSLSHDIAHHTSYHRKTTDSYQVLMYFEKKRPKKNRLRRIRRKRLQTICTPTAKKNAC